MTDDVFKLISTPYSNDGMEYLWEETISGKPKSLHIQGPFMGAEVKNRNHRIYPLHEMVREIDNFRNQRIKSKTSYGELGHPPHATIDLNNAAHLILSLEQEGNTWYGKSKIMEGTRSGDVVKGLINNGGHVGVSSRCLGQVDKDRTGTDIVSNLRMVTVDIVADPSFPEAFVDGILESKIYRLAGETMTEEENRMYENFENKISKYGNSNRDEVIKMAISEFIRQIKI